MQLNAHRGVAIFAKACFGHPSPSKWQKLNATAYASGGHDASCVRTTSLQPRKFVAAT